MGIFDDLIPSAANGAAEADRPEGYDPQSGTLRITVRPNGVQAPPAQPPVSPAARDLLIRTVVGEAANQPDDGQAAVAHVIMNRLGSGRFGNDIPNVVLAPNQFEPWQAHRTALEMLPTDAPAYQKAASIVDGVLSGDTPDPTGGATHFLNEDIVRQRRGGSLPAWAQGDSVKIGAHTFYNPGGPLTPPDPSRAVTDVSAQNRPGPSGMFDDLIPQQGSAGLKELSDLTSGFQPQVTGPQAAALGLASGLSANFHDEIVGASNASGLPGWLGGLRAPVGIARLLYEKAIGSTGNASRAYQEGRDAVRALQKAAQQQHPTASLAGDLAGAVASVPLLPEVAIAKGAGLGARTLNAAAAGGLYGAAAGAGDGEGASDTIDKAIGGGIKGAAIGTAVAPVAAAVSRVISRAPASTVPTQEALLDEAQKGFDAFRNSGLELKGSAVGSLASGIQDFLSQRGLRDYLAPKTFAILSEMKDVPVGSIVQAADIHGIRRALQAATKTADQTERGAAQTAINKLDEYVTSIPKADVAAGDAERSAGLFNDARGNYAAAKRSETVTEASERGGLNASGAGSGANIDNATRQAIKSLLKNQKSLRGFSEDEIAQMRTIVNGTFTGNAARLLGKLAPTGIVSGALSAGAGHTVGGPVGAVAFPAIGYVSKKLADYLTGRQLSKLDELVRSRSPLARQIDAASAAWAQAADDLARMPSATKYATFLLASRNLGTNLSDVGISVKPSDFLRSMLPSTPQGRADEQQPE